MRFHIVCEPLKGVGSCLTYIHATGAYRPDYVKTNMFYSARLPYLTDTSFYTPPFYTPAFCNNFLSSSHFY